MREGALRMARRRRRRVMGGVGIGRPAPAPPRAPLVVSQHPPPPPPSSQAARKTWGVKGGDAAALAAHRQKQLRRWEARAQGLSVDDEEDASEKTIGDLGKAVLASFGLVAVVALRSRVRF